MKVPVSMIPGGGGAAAAIAVVLLIGVALFAASRMAAQQAQNPQR